MNDDFGSVEKYYSEFYSRMIGHDSKGIFSYLWKYPHKLMEKPFRTNQGLKILELGAGEGEHISFVAGDFSQYVAQDINAQRLKRVDFFQNPRIVTISGDATQLNFPNETFDRLIATCLLAHLRDPESALSEWRRVLKVDGRLTVYLPCDPGIALKIFRNLFSKQKAQKLGYRGYDLFIAREHINPVQNLIIFLRNIYKLDIVRFQYFPFGIRSCGLNLFIVVQIRKTG
jgi:ubiquinone/menaquinone biosynthesis C-methylase UbiE